jgi:Holliday junction resolvasome RuvABC endonuclease subunit
VPVTNPISGIRFQPETPRDRYLTDDEIKKVSSGEVNKIAFYRAKDMEPIRGGFFDPVKFGGFKGNKWGHIELKEPQVNPVFETAVKKLTGLGGKYDDLMAGKLHYKNGEFNKDGKGTTGGAAIEQILKGINVDDEIKVLMKKAPQAKGNQLDEINKKLNKEILQLQKYAAAEDETNQLREQIREFFIAESRAAAFLYAAQRTLAQHGYQTEVVTDSAEGEPDATNYVLIHKITNMVYVRPVLHATLVHIVDGPNPKTKKPKDFGIPIIE